MTPDRVAPFVRLPLMAVVALTAGCLGGAPGATAPGGARAEAALAPTAGSSTAGSVRFVQRGDRTLVEARVSGLAPGSEHGFHVHEKGDCSAPDAMSAGGHFNPGGQPHGAPGAAARHAGDLPALVADAQGVATVRFDSELLGVASGTASVVGRSVIVHRDPDDYRTQPTGNSGARLACGVVRAG